METARTRSWASRATPDPELYDRARRQQEIEDELDLTKNQASAQLGADTPPEPPVAVADAGCLKENFDGGWD